MKIQSKNQSFAIVGLLIGLLGTLFGIHISSAIEPTPVLLGTVSAVWCAVSASIIGGRVNNDSVS